MLAIVAQLVYILGLPILYKFIFDEGIRDKNWDVLIISISLFAAGLALFGIAGSVQEYTVARLGSRTMSQLRQDLFDKLQSLSTRCLTTFDDSEIANRFSSDLSAIELAVIRAIPVVVMQSLSITLSIVMLFVIEWRLALLAVLTMPLIVIASKPFNSRAEIAMKQQSADDSSLVGLAQESFIAHLVIRLFHLQKQRIAQFVQLISKLNDSSTQAHFYTGLIGRATFVASGIMQLLVVGVGAYFVFSDYMTAGLLIAFVGLLFNVGDAVTFLTNAIPILARGSSAMERIHGIMEKESQLADTQKSETLQELKEGVRFDHVSFSYDGKNPVLSDVSFYLGAGEKTALVGPSGCGKSTVLSLIMRLYDPDSGHILLDDKPLPEYTESSLRNYMSVVLQHPVLFDATVFQNILLSQPDASHQDVIDSARSAAVLDVIEELPEKFLTRIGTGGADLSGGQRQRITIARAFLKKAGVLLLDEATSALDPNSEDLVNQSILKLPRSQTVISVTHRLASVVGFDRILVFDKGHLVENGSHEELVNASGLYNQLWEKQQGFAINVDQAVTTVTPERLLSIPFLSSCDETTLAELAKRFSLERFKEQRTVFEAGDPGDKFYIVVRGELDILAPEKDGIETPLAVLRDGDFFGEIALVEDCPRTASVRTRTNTWCLTLPRQHFIALMASHKELENTIRKTITQRRSTSDKA